MFVLLTLTSALAWEAPGPLDSHSPLTYVPGPAQRSDLLLYGSMGMGAGIAVDHALHRDWQPVGQISGAMLLTFGLTSGIKNLADRPRPYTLAPGYPDDAYSAGADDFRSFPSGHTSMTAASWMATVVTADLDGAFQTPAQRWSAYGLALAVPMFTATARVNAGKHYWSDVGTGWVIGTSIGLFTPLLIDRLVQP